MSVSTACEAVPTGGSSSQTYFDSTDPATNATNADTGCDPVAFVGTRTVSHNRQINVVMAPTRRTHPHVWAWMTRTAGCTRWRSRDRSGGYCTRRRRRFAPRVVRSVEPFTPWFKSNHTSAVLAIARTRKCGGWDSNHGRSLRSLPHSNPTVEPNRSLSLTDSDAGDGIRTHEPLRERILSPPLLAWLSHPRASHPSADAPLVVSFWWMGRGHSRLGTERYATSRR